MRRARASSLQLSTPCRAHVPTRSSKADGDPGSYAKSGEASSWSAQTRSGRAVRRPSKCSCWTTDPVSLGSPVSRMGESARAMPRRGRCSALRSSGSAQASRAPFTTRSIVFVSPVTDAQFYDSQCRSISLVVLVRLNRETPDLFDKGCTLELQALGGLGSVALLLP